jgi:hypothetical protein
MESVLYLKNHDIMPDTVLYIYYHTVFIFFCFFGFFYHTQTQYVDLHIILQLALILIYLDPDIPRSELNIS